MHELMLFTIFFHRNATFLQSKWWKKYPQLPFTKEIEQIASSNIDKLSLRISQEIFFAEFPIPLGKLLAEISPK